MSAFTPEFRCRKMLAEFASSLGMTTDVMLSKSRSRDIAWRRQAFMLLARRAGFSFPVIGRTLGLDHSTVVEGARKAEARLSEHDETRCPCCGGKMPNGAA